MTKLTKQATILAQNIYIFVLVYVQYSNHQQSKQEPILLIPKYTCELKGKSSARLPT